MVLPPLEAGAVQEMTDCEFSPEVAVTEVGASGTDAALVTLIT